MVFFFGFSKKKKLFNIFKIWFFGYFFLIFENQFWPKKTQKKSGDFLLAEYLFIILNHLKLNFLIYDQFLIINIREKKMEKSLFFFFFFYLNNRNATWTALPCISAPWLPPVTGAFIVLSLPTSSKLILSIGSWNFSMNFEFQKEKEKKKKKNF